MQHPALIRVCFPPHLPQDVDTLAIVVDRSKTQLKGASHEAELPVQHLADVATRVLGVQPVHPEYVPAFVEASPLAKVRANLLVAVESLGEDYLSNHHMQHLQELRNKHHSFKLVGQSYPRSATALSATLATGATVAQHGIVGDGWFTPDGVKQHAYESAAAAATVGSVADIVSQSFGGRSLTASVSSTPALAAAHAVHPSLRAAHPSWHNLAFAVKGRAFASLYPSAQHHLELSFGDVEHILASEGLPKLVKDARFSLNAHERSLQVTVGAHSATYSLETEECAEFFAELVFVDHLLHQLQDAPALAELVADQYPDSYAITLSALRGVREKFGERSPQFLVAVRLLDSAVPAIVDRVAAMYGNSVVAEVVVLGAERHVLGASVVAAVERVLPTEASDEFFPAIYTRPGTDAALVCASLKHEFADDKDVQVLCAPAAAHATAQGAQLIASESRVFQTMGVGAAATPVTDADIAIYQIVLWTSILLVLVVVGVVYGLLGMENKRDSMLYSRFNPNWADRKRR